MCSSFPRWSLVAGAVVAAGCGRASATPGPASPRPAPASASAPAAGPVAASPDDASDAAFLARSTALLDAYDRDDLAALDRALAPGFVKFENQHLEDRAALLEASRGRGLHPPAMTRAWAEHHVYRRDGDAVLIARTIEHETGNDVHGNRAYEGWYTIGWVRDGGAWRAAHWSWQPHRTSIENARETWNNVYRQARGFDPRPNRLLVDTVRGVAPGAALDVMTGQGRNALYLASQGWRVTGIDIADEGLRIARDTAARQHLELATVQADAEKYDYGVARWDLVTMLYAGSSTALIERLKPSIKPGGRFVLEFFHTVPGERGGFTIDQLRGLFADGFEVVRADAVDDVPDWAKDRARLVRFVARKK